jgi:RecB family exonuclease
VRLLSAHRAKGLEWELVVVASVQEGQWPDVRLRSDLLRVSELGPRGRIEGLTHADLLAEERRLMYVACTRARSWLVVSAVAERVEGGLQASRFLAELGQEVQAMPVRSASPMSAEGLIAALREAAEAPATVRADGSSDPQVEEVRGAAIQRLAALAVRARESGPLGPMAAAEPTRWWGAQPLTGVATFGAPAAVGGLATQDASVGADETMQPMRLSPSAVAALRDCPLRWFLDRRVGAGNPSGGAAVVGLVVHAVAEALARGDVAPDPREIGPFVDEIWASVPFPAHYQRVHERRRVDDMITALLAWDASTGRSVAATELTFHLPVPGAARPVSVSGSIDRVDRSEDGRLHVVDFKTGRTAASAAATAEHPQLGIYQLAIRLGALDGGGDPRVPGAVEGALGAEQPDTVVLGAGAGQGPADPDARGTSEASLAPDTLADDAPAELVVLGPAELVHLADRFASGMPKVRFQDPIDDGWTWVNDLIVDAARLADGSEYPARPNGHCKSCAFRFMCPAQSPAAAGQPAVAATAATAEPQGEQAGAPAAPTRSRTSPGLPTGSAAQPRPSMPEVPVQQSLWGDDL